MTWETLPMDTLLPVEAISEDHSSPVDQSTFHFSVDGLVDQLQLQQDSRLGCGGRVWSNAARLLTRHLSAYGSSSIGNRGAKRWLELGCGTGAVGLAACRLLGPEEIQSMVLTDLPHVMPLIQQNVHLNLDPPWWREGRLQVRPLIWGLFDSIDSSTTSSSSTFDSSSTTTTTSAPSTSPLSPQIDLPWWRADVILVSDCVYLEDLFQPLLDTLCFLMPPCEPNGEEQQVCWMTYQRRRRAEKRFFKALEKEFQVTLLTRGLQREGFAEPERQTLTPAEKKQVQSESRTVLLELRRKPIPCPMGVCR